MARRITKEIYSRAGVRKGVGLEDAFAAVKVAARDLGIAITKEFQQEMATQLRSTLLGDRPDRGELMFRELFGSDTGDSPGTVGSSGRFNIFVSRDRLKNLEEEFSEEALAPFYDKMMVRVGVAARRIMHKSIDKYFLSKEDLKRSAYFSYDRVSKRLSFGMHGGLNSTTTGRSLSEFLVPIQSPSIVPVDTKSIYLTGFSPEGKEIISPVVIFRIMPWVEKQFGLRGREARAVAISIAKKMTVNGARRKPIVAAVADFGNANLLFGGFGKNTRGGGVILPPAPSTGISHKLAFSPEMTREWSRIKAQTRGEIRRVLGSGKAKGSLDFRRARGIK